jgi:hypothetical protein
MNSKSIVRADSSLIEILECRIAPAIFIWTGAFSSTWNDPRNWANITLGGNNGFPGTSPDSQPDFALFNDSTSPTVTLSAGVTIHSLEFLGSGSPKITGQTIIFSSLNESPEIKIGAATSPEVDSNIALSSTFPLLLESNVAAAGSSLASNLTLGGVLSDGFTGNPPAYGGFSKTGAGNVTLVGSGANTFPNTGAGSHPGNGPGFIVSEGGVFLNKSTTKAAISSDLKITGGFVSIVSADEQIADTASVEVDSPGLLQLTQNETIHQLSGTGVVNGTSGTKLTLKANSTFGGSFGGTGTQTQFDLGLTGTVLTLSGTQPENTSALIRTVGGQLNVTGIYPTMDIVLTGPSASDPGVLSGTGAVGNVKTTGSGIVAPGTGTTFSAGNGFGTLAVNNLSGTAPSNLLTLNLDVTSDFSDAIDLRGTLDQNTVATQFLVSGPSFSEGQVFQVFSLPSTAAQLPDLTTHVQGGFSSFPDGSTVAYAGTDFPLHIHYNGGDGNDVVLVAEPSLTSIAPTSISSDGKTATFLQEDGDTLTIKTSEGKFVPGNFLFEALPSELSAGAGRLEQINLDAGDFGTLFQGAKITGTVTKGVNGDGFADVGSVNAEGVDLAVFKLAGDLGNINAGDANFKTTGLGTLSVLSLGAKGNLTYTANAQANFTSSIEGKLGALKVTAGKLNETNTPTLPDTAGILGQAFVDVIGEATAADDKFEGIGKVIIDRVDGSNTNGVNEVVQNGGTTVAYTPGTVRTAGPIGSVLVNTSLEGSSSDFSGEIWSRTSIGSVTIGADLIGGTGEFSGGVFVGSPDDESITGGKLGMVNIKGDIFGGDGLTSGVIAVEGGIGPVTVDGNIQGGTEFRSGSIISGGGITSLTIKGSLFVGDVNGAGSIGALGNIGAIKVAGSISADTAVSTRVGIFAGGSISSITAGSMTSNGGTGIISAFGKTGGGAAIGSVKVHGDVTGWDIAAGYDTTFDVTGTNGGTFNPDASIGTVTVSGAFTNSAITAGTLWGPDGAPGGFLHGNPDAPTDSHMPGDTLPNVLAKISKITIAGQSANSVFEAQKLTGIKIAGAAALLTSGTDNLDLGNSVFATEIQ